MKGRRVAVAVTMVAVMMVVVMSVAVVGVPAMRGGRMVAAVE